MPERIQLRRVKGWRKPEGAVNVARPGKWGNPFKVGSRLGDVPAVLAKKCGYMSLSMDTVLTAEMAVNLYRAHLARYPHLLAQIRQELRGRDLACWCKPGEPCHADVLLEVANSEADND